MMKNLLNQLRNYSLIAIDTIDDKSVEKYSPVLAMINPSFIFLAASFPGLAGFQKTFIEALIYGKKEDRDLTLTFDFLCVILAEKLLKLIPNRVSIQIDARLCYDKEAQVKRALRILSFFKQRGISKDKILISLVSTWEGIMAARELEKNHGIKCNLTLIFGLTQAAVCAEAGVYMVSTSVEGINASYLKNNFYKTSQKGIDAAQSIYYYFKKNDIPTLITGSCFGNEDQIKFLSGCDYLSITPSLLCKLQEKSPVTNISIPYLTVEKAKSIDDVNLNKIIINNKEEFENKLNNEKWAESKLSQGIIKYGESTIKLENLIKERFESLVPKFKS